MPLTRAATLLGTNTAKIKQMMGDGTLEWAQVPRGTSLLVAEDDVMKLALERQVGIKSAAKRAKAGTRTARERGISMLSNPGPPPTGIFQRTWDPSPTILPISGRDDTKGKT